MQIDDKELLERMARGGAEGLAAYNEAYKKYYSNLVKRLHIGNHGVSEDECATAVDEHFMKLYTGVVVAQKPLTSGGKPVTRLFSYLEKCAGRDVRKRFGKKRQEHEDAYVDDLLSDDGEKEARRTDSHPDPGPSQAEYLKALELADYLRDCRRRLPAEQQDMLTKYYDEGQTYREIGAAIGIAHNTVGGRLHAIANTLRICLSDKGINLDDIDFDNIPQI